MEDLFEHRIFIYGPGRESDPIFEMKSEKTFVSFSKGDILKYIGDYPMQIESIEHRFSKNAQGISILTSIYTTKLS